MRFMALPLVLLLASLGNAAAADGLTSKDGRLVMTKMDLAKMRSQGRVEGLREPERYSGYFKLNR
jgi:hypothetical protein